MCSQRESDCKRVSVCVCMRKTESVCMKKSWKGVCVREVETETQKDLQGAKDKVSYRQKGDKRDI